MPDFQSPQTQWKKGPLPADTWNWGAVVTKETPGSSGFFFADFRGDHAITIPGNVLVNTADVLFYNNSIDMPPAK